MPPLAANRSRPAASHREAMGVDDPGRFATVRGFPILDAHPPIVKKVRDPDNPDGPVEMTLEVTAEDLATIAANSNAMVAAGRLPFLQIGHTPLDDRPEAWHPKPVGLTSNYSVCVRDGEPWLCADLHFRRDLLEEASTYPNLSVERVDWSDPATHRIDAVSLLRRAPERSVPLVPYASDAVPAASPRACYGRDVPGPGATGTRTGMTSDRQRRIDLCTAFDITPAEARRHLAAGTKPDPSRRHKFGGSSPAGEDPARRQRRIDFGTKHAIFDPAALKAKFAEAEAKGLA